LTLPKSISRRPSVKYFCPRLVLAAWPPLRRHGGIFGLSRHNGLGAVHFTGKAGSISDREGSGIFLSYVGHRSFFLPESVGLLAPQKQAGDH
jgi:hypothetical protein